MPPKFQSAEKELVVDRVIFLGKFCERTILAEQELVVDWVLGKFCELVILEFP